jgi:ribosomal protein S18 acetylase RimI-like enzyme
MPLREFRMPADTALVVDLIRNSFQYPENEAWSIQSDDVQNTADTMAMIRRFWPLIFVIGALSPYFRNAFRGFIWEEDGKPVALANTGTQGNTNRWWIGNVGVLPAYRRRGLARKLVDACVDLARRNRAPLTVLDVIKGNDPAVRLYESLGFTTYATATTLEFTGKAVPPALPLPTDYAIRQLTPFDWRPRFELDRSTIPAETLVFQPIDEQQYRVPLVIRPLALLFRNVGSSRGHSYVIRYTATNRIAATCGFSGRVRPGGVNHVRISVDPSHAAIAPAVVSHVLNALWAFSPERRIEADVPNWQPAVIDALCAAGFHVTREMYSMGLKLSSHG